MNCTVRIPDRSPLNPVARFKITLELSGAPAGSSLTVFGATNNFPFTTVIGGNIVRFTAGTGNSAVLDIVLQNDFNPNDYINLKPAAVRPLDIAITFTEPGGVTVTGYRLSSYAAPSTQAKGCPSRRLDNNPVTFIVAPSSGTNLGRHAIDTLLVLDRSGSMNWPVPPGLPNSTGEAKLPVLKSAVSQFIDAWKVEATGVPGDRLAVIWFSSTAAAVGGFVRRDTAGGWDGLKTGVNAQTASGSTALGDGLSIALKMHDDDPLNDATVILMTNGMQNAGHQIIPDVADPSLEAFFDLAASPPANVSIASKCVPVQTVGVGAPGTVQTDLLNKIASQTGGKPDLMANSTIDFAFLNLLVEILKGNTLSTRLQMIAVLPEGTKRSQPITFELGPFASQAIAVLSWRGTQFGLGLELTAPDGNGELAVQTANEAFYQILTIEKDVIDKFPGDWRAVVFRREAGSTIEYHLTVMLVEVNLAYSLYFENQDPTTGEPIILHADMSLDGVPLPGLANTALQVAVQAPPGALGTILHNTSVSGDVLKNNPPGADPDAFNTPAQRKIQHLIDNEGLGKQISPSKVDSNFLLDDGQAASGDKQAGDGSYSYRFANTQTPGLYRFQVTMDIDTPKTGKVRRVEERELEVRIQQLAKESIQVVAGKVPGDYIIQVTPVDAFGNFLGPDYGDLLDLRVSGGGNLAPLSDSQATGAYTANLTQVPAGADPVISLNYDGRPVRSDPLSSYVSKQDWWKTCLLTIIGLIGKLLNKP